MVPRQERIMRTEWEPRREADPDSESAAIGERDERGRIVRTSAARTGHPSPPIANECPSAVVERCESPRFVGDPNPAPRFHPGPVTLTIRHPARVDVRRIPDRPDLDVGFPAAVRVEIAHAGDVRIDIGIGRRNSAGERAIAERTPRIESIRTRTWNVHDLHATAVPRSETHRAACLDDLRHVRPADVDAAALDAHDRLRTRGVGLDAIIAWRGAPEE